MAQAACWCTHGLHLCMQIEHRALRSASHLFVLGIPLRHTQLLLAIGRSLCCETIAIVLRETIAMATSSATLDGGGGASTSMDHSRRAS
jgi:hypothetical protein